MDGRTDVTHTDRRTADLEALRRRLDRIDEDLLATLRARLACCVDIAHYKREHGVPMMQPHRIGLVQQRAARFALEHGIEPDFLRRLYELVIAETCRVEELVIRGRDALLPTADAVPVERLD